MPYTIWQTPHPINQTVVNTLAKGIQRISETGRGFPLKPMSEFRTRDDLTPSISYGILRGTGLIFQACRDNGIEFWEIDRGFWRASHFDGYYRFSLNGMNPDYVPDIAQRFRPGCLIPKLEPWRKDGRHILFCPPSKYVTWFYDLQPNWAQETMGQIARASGRPVNIRTKGDGRPIEEDFKNCHCVITHSSNIALDALRNGVPAICLGRHPVAGWNSLGVKDIEADLTAYDREALFNFLSWQQYNLMEIAEGYPWEVVHTMQKYKSTYLR